MSSCLGLYIEKNVIKYAKVTKEREILKVEAFGVKIYEKIGEALEQIISETFSYNIPISVNLSDEIYNYFYMFSLLNKNDLKKAIDTEFESYCFEKKINKNVFETRYAISNEIDDKDKVKIIHISSDKTSISKLTQLLANYKLSTITPIGTSISNIASIQPKENILIVNIEEQTIITSIINQKVYDIQKLEIGSKEILTRIKEKENSYLKAYEICKESTIYTMEGKELQEKENEYLDYIMPTIYKIVTQVQEYVQNSQAKYDKIYITGTMSVVSNIDLYFQEFFNNEKCEILKPYFITENLKINIKDYIEVNSAIAVGMQGLGYGIRNMNFKNPSFSDKMPEWLKLDMSLTKKEKKNYNVDFSLKGKFDNTEKWLLRLSSGVLILSILYSLFSIYINKQISCKMSEADEVAKYTDSQIQLVKNDINATNQKASKYKDLENNLRDINDKVEDNLNMKGSVPNLLIRIMAVIPQQVQITEIENTSSNNNKHIVINAQSKYYDELGYFKAKLKEDGILKNVVSTQGEKQEEFVKIVIEGDMP